MPKELDLTKVLKKVERRLRQGDLAGNAEWIAERREKLAGTLTGAARSKLLAEIESILYGPGSLVDAPVDGAGALAVETEDAIRAERARLRVKPPRKKT
ncbi:MAG: hypothetical protein HYV09_39605 [Deltaproteobacteria bacterium]|nr:hypothetical protein [Deltaproteobacteria bacterium]